MLLSILELGKLTTHRVVLRLPLASSLFPMQEVKSQFVLLHDLSRSRCLPWKIHIVPEYIVVLLAF